MSEWVKIRDKIVDAIKIDDVTENVKQDFARWVLDDLMPVVKGYADDFVETIRLQAEDESGWCKIRDMIVLPLVIDGGIWLIEMALSKSFKAELDG